MTEESIKVQQKALSPLTESAFGGLHLEISLFVFREERASLPLRVKDQVEVCTTMVLWCPCSMHGTRGMLL